MSESTIPWNRPTLVGRACPSAKHPDFLKNCPADVEWISWGVPIARVLNMIGILTFALVSAEEPSTKVVFGHQKEVWKYVVLVDPPLAPSDRPSIRHNVRLVPDPQLKPKRIIPLDVTSKHGPSPTRSQRTLSGRITRIEVVE
jgi:hypothetical protein